jgi:hypothetical protein
MEEQGVVALARPSTGGVAIRVADGSYVLAEQLDAKPLEVGKRLSGRMNSVGIEALFDMQSGDRFAVFVQAFGCSYEAVRDALA